MINDDEQGGFFDKTVIGPSKRGSSRSSGAGGSASPGEPTVLLTRSQPARSASGQQTVIIDRQLHAEKALPDRTEGSASIRQLFLEQILFGPNPVLAAAYPILVATARLRREWPAGSLSELRDGFAQAVGKAVSALEGTGLSDDVIHRAKLVLCELIDETMSQFGGEAELNTVSGMMPTFFQTPYTGTGFFKILNELLTDPQANRDELEFMHVCLCLGFMGQYRGRREADLRRVRDDLRDALRAPDARQKRQLSSPASPERRAASGWIPWLAVTVGAAAITGAIFLGMDAVLDREAASVTARLDALNASAATTTEGGALAIPAESAVQDNPN